MHAFPQLETERLILNQLTASDIPDLVEQAGHPEISNNTLTIPYPYTEKHAITFLYLNNKRFEAKSQYSFAIRLKTSHQLWDD